MQIPGTHTYPATPRVSYSVGLEWSPRVCISSKFSGDVEAMALKCSVLLPSFVNNALAYL